MLGLALLEVDDYPARWLDRPACVGGLAVGYRNFRAAMLLWLISDIFQQFTNYLSTNILDS